MDTIYAVLIVFMLITLIEVRILGVIGLLLLMLVYGIIYTTNQLVKWSLSKLKPSYDSTKLQDWFQKGMDYIYSLYKNLQDKFKE